MTEQNASVDFDFFETPRSPSRSEVITSSVLDNKNSKSGSNRDDVKKKQWESLSPTPSNRSTQPDYSSDSPVSDTESESAAKSKQQKLKVKKRSLSISSSGSSFSSRSRSRSESDSDRSSSRSRSSSGSGNDKRRKRKQSGKNTQPKGNISRKDEEDDYSSSAYSDGENEKSMNSFEKQPTPLRKNGNRQAWGDDPGRDEKNTTGKRQSAKARPMTAKNRSSQRRRSGNHSSSQSDSDTLSDSDITDVSPMESPRTQNKPKMSRVGAGGDGDSVKVQYRAMPVSDKDLNLEESEDPHDGSRGGLDLEILMKAVGELEKQKRVEANTRRVMFAPMTLKRSDKNNYTFDKDKSRDIDRENQRLLSEIVRRVSSGDQRKQYRRVQAPASRMTPSAVNREKEIRRIETENVSFLRRLQKVKPTQTISRTNQIRAYEGTKLHGIPISTLHPMPNTGKRTGSRADDSVSSIGSRTRSLTSLHSAVSSVRSSVSRRSSRPSSATKRVDTRPEWNDRW